MSFVENYYLVASCVIRIRWAFSEKRFEVTSSTFDYDNQEGVCVSTGEGEDALRYIFYLLRETVTDVDDGGNPTESKRSGIVDGVEDEENMSEKVDERLRREIWKCKMFFDHKLKMKD